MFFSNVCMQVKLVNILTYVPILSYENGILFTLWSSGTPTYIYILYLSIRLYTVHVTYSELSCRDTRPTVTSIVVIIKFNIQTFKTARPYSCPWKGRCLFHILLVGFCNLSWQRPNRSVLCDEEYGWTCIKTLIPVHQNLLTISTTHCSEQFVTEDHYRIKKNWGGGGARAGRGL